MITLSVDENEVRKMYMEELKEHIKKVDAELVFWDTNELKRRTSMSWNTIQERFFFDPRFPKYKVCRKWYFPAEKTKEFLLMWLEEQI